MSRQTKYPPIFSLCLAIVRHSDGKILVSSLSEQKPNSKKFAEFPNNLYSDVLSIPLEASLEDRPSEEMRKAVAAKKLSELSPSMPFSSNSESIIDLGLYESPNWGVCMYVSGLKAPRPDTNADDNLPAFCALTDTTSSTTSWRL
jgi:hypothetical protein